MTTRIPSDFIHQLLDHIDIIDVIDQFIHLKKSGTNYFACCPFHTEKSASFSVSATKQFYHCFGCGAHGNVIDFLMQYDRLTFVEAIEKLAQRAGLDIPHQISAASKKPSYDSLYQLMDKVAEFYQKKLRASETAIHYLKNRGLSGTIAKKFGVGFAPPGFDSVLRAFGQTKESKAQLLQSGLLIQKDEGGCYDRFRDRLMFPIRDRRGRIVGFGGRVLNQGEPKYLNSPETSIFSKGHELYGLYHVLKAHRQLARLLIVEGYMDVIALAQYEIDFAVATLGTATTAQHILQIHRHTSEIIFCYDGDSAGRMAAWRALEVIFPLMQDGMQIKFLFLPDGEDPDSYVRKVGKEAFLARIQEASNVSTFFFYKLSHDIDLRQMDGRARFVKLSADYINRLPDSVFRQMLISELAHRAHMRLEELQPFLTRKNISTVKRKVFSKTPSALRTALMLLIQHPSLISMIEGPLLRVDIPGFGLLSALIELLQAQPSLTTASIIEHWRDRPEANVLLKLASLEHAVPLDGLEAEFKGLLRRLKALAKEQKVNGLMTKAQQQLLTTEEKQLLQDLLVEKEKG